MIARLQAELAGERSRANAAEQQLVEVHTAVRAYKQKQEQLAYARKAREARALAAQAAEFEKSQAAERVAAAAEAQLAAQASVAAAPAIGSPTGNAVAEAWQDPDPSLDERLDKYLENSFEPDRSRNWMLQE